MNDRPSFVSAWAASQKIYDPDNPAARVAAVIGGKVAVNVNGGFWANTCAVRMSYILNHSGMTLPHIVEKTVSGADGKWYFFHVRDLIDFLRQQWGAPDEIVNDPPSGGGPLLAGKKGVILFEVSGWSDAQGHATLFDGKVCYDHGYFNEPGANYHTDRANFWQLP